MRIGLPPGVAEALLFALIVGVAVFLFRAARRRGRVLPTGGTDVPVLQTQQRVTAKIIGITHDAAQGVVLCTARIGRRRFVFCAADYATNTDRYKELMESKAGADFALFALATLAPGDVTQIKEQIRDFDKIQPSPDFVTLIPQGQYRNDYFTIAKLLDVRDETWDDTVLRVFRSQVIRTSDFTMVLDLAVQAENAPLTPPTHAHGSARLFGYLA